jgi:hypothetical protein
MKTTALLLALIAGIFCNEVAQAQPGLPAIPEMLNGYLFQDTNFLSVFGDEPLSQTNLALVAHIAQLHHDGTPIELNLRTGTQALAGNGQLKLEF